MLGRLGGTVMVAAAIGAGACAGRQIQSPSPRQNAQRAPVTALPDNTVKDTTAWQGATPARAEELLAGRFPGVQVIRLANGDYSVRIRGTSTLLGSAEPLYVVDGVELPQGFGGGLAGINPLDIATIQVLKDAGSTAMYGVRGSNGVIIVTTKRGP